MKRKISLLLVIVSLVFSAICIKEDRVFALKERACIGDGCPQDIVSHYDYTDHFESGLKYAISDYFVFEFDYSIMTYVNYTNGYLTSVNSPKVTPGSLFNGHTAEYNVNYTVLFDYDINSARTSASCTLTLMLRMTGQIPSVIYCEPIVIRYTVS